MLGDMRYALRQVVKAPAFSIAAIVTLALGIGAAAAMLTLAILGEDDRQIGGMDTAGPSAKRDGRNQLIPDRSLGTLAKALGAPATRRMAIVTAEANCRSLAACESQEPHRRGAE